MTSGVAILRHKKPLQTHALGRGWDSAIVGNVAYLDVPCIHSSLYVTCRKIV